MDASTGGTIRTLNEDQVKELIGKICQNEYHSQYERGIKPIASTGTPKEVLTLENHVVLLDQL